MYSTFRIYMISITLCATVLCCYGWSSSSTSSYWDDPASYSRLRLLSPFWMALLTARTTHFIFFAVGGSNSNQKTKSRSNFSSPTVCHSKNGNIELSAIRDFLTLIFFFWFVEVLPGCQGQIVTKTPSMYADPSNEGYNAIRLGSTSPSTIAPTYNARQRFDGLVGY